ncbi:MAG: DUF2267 domain-containing protein [Micavibrio sp.]
MSMTGLPVFDKTLQSTNMWLNEISDELGTDRQQSFHALKAVLHALRDRLLLDESAHFSAQLPILVRGIYFDGWNPAHTPNRERGEDMFLNHVAEGLQNIRPVDPESACRAVFSVLERHISKGEMSDIKVSLPKVVLHLWAGGRPGREPPQAGHEAR